MLPPADRAALERQLAPAHRALGSERVDVAWQAGTILSPEQAVAMALAPALPASHGTLEPAPAPSPFQPPSPALQPPDAPDPLTSREREVVRLVARGLTNRQIAEALVVSERTAEWHVANTLSKLGLGTRAQLAVWAAQRVGDAD